MSPINGQFGLERCKAVGGYWCPGSDEPVATGHTVAFARLYRSHLYGAQAHAASKGQYVSEVLCLHPLNLSI